MRPFNCCISPEYIVIDEAQIVLHHWAGESMEPEYIDTTIEKELSNIHLFPPDRHISKFIYYCDENVIFQ